jgi:YVTN family beta-propeller protein
LALACLVGSAAGFAQNAYITNFGDNTVSVIDTATDTVIATIPVGDRPYGVAVTPDGSKVYVANQGFNPRFVSTVSVIDAATNTVSATIRGGRDPIGVAVSPDGSKVYVVNRGYPPIPPFLGGVASPTATGGLSRRTGPPSASCSGAMGSSA